MESSSDLRGPMVKRLQEALLAAFPTRSELAQMVHVGLDKNLDVIAASENLGSAVFELIRWAKAQGRLEELIAAALKENPGNPELRAFAKALGPQSPQSPSPPPISGATTEPAHEDVEARALGEPRRRIAKWISIVLACLALGGAYVSTADSREIAATARRMGLRRIEQGKYSTEENERLANDIRNAKTIKILAPNASTFAQAFKDDMKHFFLNPNASMLVLFGTPDSEFYRELVQMTFKSPLSESAQAYQTNMDQVEFSRKRLIDYTQNQNQLQVRYFNSQYRMTIIIIDDRRCYLTVRLPPDEGQDSPRLEFDGGYSQNCLIHFNRLWELSRVDPIQREPKKP